MRGRFILAAALVLAAGEVSAQPESEADAGAPDGGQSPGSTPDDPGSRGEALTDDELAQLCQGLASDSTEERREASAAIMAAGRSSIATIRQRLRRELRSAPGDIEDLLQELGDGRSPMRLPPRREDPPLDVLPELLGRERPEEDDLRLLNEVTEVVVLLRTLSLAGSSAATREMVRYGPRERGVFTAEIARNVKRMGDPAIPGLLSATRHPDDEVSELAVELLDWLRKSTHGSQIQVRDPEVLAEILTFYGEAGDRDAIPVLLSFSGSEKAIVRQAAREAVMRFGRAALWPTRIKYENFTGEEPSRSWGWRELITRLFEAQDQARMAQAEQAMSRGLELAQAGRFEEMLDHYEQILGRWPRYERRPEMVPGLVAYSAELDRQGDRRRARELIHQALLLDPEGEPSRDLRAKLLLWQIEADMARGIADPVKLERLDQLGFESTQAEAISERIDDQLESRPPHYYRMMAAVGLGLFGLACAGLLIYRGVFRKRPSEKEEPARENDDVAGASQESERAEDEPHEEDDRDEPHEEGDRDEPHEEGDRDEPPAS